MDTDHPDMKQRTVLTHAAHTAQVMRDAIKRELESEGRGLLMAAAMHGFRLEMTDGKLVAFDERGA